MPTATGISEKTINFQLSTKGIRIELYDFDAVDTFIQYAFLEKLDKKEVLAEQDDTSNSSDKMGTFRIIGSKKDSAFTGTFLFRFDGDSDNQTKIIAIHCHVEESALIFDCYGFGIELTDDLKGIIEAFIFDENFDQETENAKPPHQFISYDSASINYHDSDHRYNFYDPKELHSMQSFFMIQQVTQTIAGKQIIDQLNQQFEKWKTAQEKILTEQAETQRLAAERLAKEKIAAEKEAAEKLAIEQQAEADRIKAESQAVNEITITDSSELPTLNATAQEALSEKLAYISALLDIITEYQVVIELIPSVLADDDSPIHSDSLKKIARHHEAYTQSLSILMSEDSDPQDISDTLAPFIRNLEIELQLISNLIGITITAFDDTVPVKQALTTIRQYVIQLIDQATIVAYPQLAALKLNTTSPIELDKNIPLAPNAYLKMSKTLASIVVLLVNAHEKYNIDSLTSLLTLTQKLDCHLDLELKGYDHLIDLAVKLKESIECYQREDNLPNYFDDLVRLLESINFILKSDITTPALTTPQEITVPTESFLPAVQAAIRAFENSKYSPLQTYYKQLLTMQHDSPNALRVSIFSMPVTPANAASSDNKPATKKSPA